MSKYRKFESYLKSYLDEKIHKSHIADLVNEGARTAIFSVNSNGSFKFSFSGGHATWGKTYKNLDSFYKSSEMLEDLEGLGYALVSSCVDAEKSTTKNVPSNYKIVLHITDSEVFNYKVATPQD